MLVSAGSGLPASPATRLGSLEQAASAKLDKTIEKAAQRRKILRLIVSAFPEYGSGWASATL